MAEANGGESEAAGLGERELRMLDFERHWRRHDGLKEEAIRAEFGVSAARYYQVLYSVIDSPNAVRHDPMLVKQLQAARERRSSARAARSFTSAVPGDTQPQRAEEESND